MERRLENKILLVYGAVVLLIFVVTYGLWDIYSQVQDIHKILLDAMMERG